MQIMKNNEVITAYAPISATSRVTETVTKELMIANYV